MINFDDDEPNSLAYANMVLSSSLKTCYYDMGRASKSFFLILIIFLIVE